jgi:transposase-like protein
LAQDEPSFRLADPHYLFRAVDSQGQTVDFYLSETRDREVAKRFLKKALANPDNRPPRVFRAGWLTQASSSDS